MEIIELHTGQLLTIPTTDTPILVGPLHPYFIYECRVAAFTVAIGPFSAPIHVVAGETRKLFVYLHITVSWLCRHINVAY